jgi:hypothetical protein
VPALTFYRLRELTDIDPTDLDQYVDTDEHELAVYGPIDGPDFRGRSQVVSATTCENPGDRNQEDVGGDPFDEGAEAAGAPAEGEGAASR